MNYTSAIFLVNKSVRAIAVSYEVDEKGVGKRPYYTFKSIVPSLLPGDYVVIPADSRHQMTVVRVEEVDVDVDFESPIQLKWIIARVDKAEYEATLRKEDAAIVAIKSAEKRRKQDELRDALLKDNPELNNLMTVGNGTAQLSPPPPPVTEE